MKIIRVFAVFSDFFQRNLQTLCENLSNLGSAVSSLTDTKSASGAALDTVDRRCTAVDRVENITFRNILTAANDAVIGFRILMTGDFSPGNLDRRF